MADDRDRVFREISALGVRDFAQVGPECMTAAALAAIGQATANAAALVAIPDTGFTEGSLAYVATYGDFFSWHPGQSLAPAAGVVINGPTGQWTRMGVPNAKWQTQVTWSIDESNVSGLASDENTGIDDTHPLLNIDEFIRRMGAGSITATITVRWLSDTTHTAVNMATLVSGTFLIGVPAPFLIFQGVPTVIRSGTLTGVTTAPWTLTDSSLSVSWSSSGCLSTTSGTRLIRNTAQTKHAAMAYENVAKTVSTSPSNGYVPTYPAAGASSATFIVGDTYDVISLPKFPRLSISDPSVGYNGVNFYYLDMQGVGAGLLRVINCGFRAFAQTNSAIHSGSVNLLGVIFVSGGSISGMSGQNVLDRCITLGTFQGTSWGGDLNTMNNVVAKAGLFQQSHSSYARLGTIYVFDSTASPAIQVTNNSAVTIDGIHGSGNAGLIIDIRDSGCSVNSPTTTPLTAFDATTSAPHPIQIVGTQYDYTAIPISAQMASNNASFTTN